MSEFIASKPSDFIKVKEIVESYQKIVIFHHIRPDGDCLGSQFGLKELLETNYPHKEISAVGDSKGIHDFFEFPFDSLGEDFDFSTALALVVDVGNFARIECNYLLKNFPKILRIDHHSNLEDDFGQNVERWINPSYIAACEQITDLAKNLGWKITPKAANYLYLGLYTDSNRFLYAAVSIRTLELAKLLWESGADKDNIHQNLKKTTLKKIKITSYIMENFSVGRHTIYFYCDLETQRKLDINDPLEASFPNVLANIEGHPIWAYFTQEKDNQIRCEFRSIPQLNVAEIAKQFGGGGHRNASGAQVQNPQEIEKIIQICDQQIQKYLDSLVS